MRSPSSRILANRVDIYVGTSSQDAEGAPQWTFPAAPTYSQVPSSVQYEAAAIEEENGRITTINTYWLLFGQSIALMSRARVVWTDVSPAKTMFIDGIPPSEAGRDSAFTARAIERI